MKSESSNRWLPVIITYHQTGILEPCPFCGGELEIEVLETGRGSTNILCKACCKIGHIDGKVVRNEEKV